MKIFWVSLILSFCFVVTGHAQKSQGKTGDFQTVVKKEVESAVRSFFAGFGTAKCDDVTPVTKFIRDNPIYVAEKDIYTITHAEYEEGVRERVCGWTSHLGVVDSIVVDPLSKDIAVAAWVYHDEIKLKSGEIKKARGSGLMTFVRSTTGWKMTSTTSAEQKVP